MGFEQGFDMFSIMNMLFPLFFIIILGIILFTIFKNIKQWNYNNKQPKLNVDALVVSKRTQVRGEETIATPVQCILLPFKSKAVTEWSSL
jgi:hypothetical protein